MKNELGKDPGHVVTPGGKVGNDVLERVEGGPWVAEMGTGWRERRERDGWGERGREERGGERRGRGGEMEEDEVERHFSGYAGM